MADTIGIKLGIEGEKEFKKAISDINQDFKVLGSELKAVTSQFDANDKSVKNLAAQNEVLNKQITAQKDKIETLRTALKNSAESFGENDSRTKKWQIQLNNAEADLNKLNRQLENNKKDMNAAEHETEQETTALKNMGTTADKTGSKLSSLGKVISSAMAAGAAAVAAIGTATVAAGKKMWDFANDVSETGDEIDKMSQKIGISAESYQEWAYVFERSGADINNLQAGMKTLSKVIVDAADGSDTAAKKLAAVGLSVEDLNGKSQDEQLSIIIEALQNMGSGAERTAAATALLGKSATELGAVLNLTAEETAALKDEAERYGMVMSDEAVKASVDFKDSLTKLNGTISGVKNRLVGELLPGLTQITGGLSDMIAGVDGGKDKFSKGVTDMVTSLKKIIPQATEIFKTVTSAILPSAVSLIGELGGVLIEGLPELVNELLPVAIDSAELLLNSVIDELPELLKVGMSTVLPKLVTGTLNVAGNLISQLSANLPQLMTTLSTSIVDTLKTLTSPENIQKAVGLLLSTVESIIAGLQQAAPILIQGATQLVTQLVSQLPTIVTQITAEIPTILGQIFGEGGLLSAQNVGLLIDGAVDAAMAIVNATPQIVNALVEAIPDIIDGFFDPDNGFLSSENIMKLIDGATSVVKQLILNIPKIIKSLLESLPNIINSIIGAFGSLLDGFLGLGEGCGQAMIQGLVRFLFSWAYGLSGLPISGSQVADMIFGNMDEAPTDKYDEIKNTTIPQLAVGGIVKRPTMALIGESGTEAVVPLEHNTDWIDKIVDQFYRAGASMSAAAPANGGINVNVTFSGDVNMNSDRDIEDVAHQVGEYIAAEVFSAGRAWA